LFNILRGNRTQESPSGDCSHLGKQKQWIEWVDSSFHLAKRGNTLTGYGASGSVSAFSFDPLFGCDKNSLKAGGCSN